LKVDFKNISSIGMTIFGGDLGVAFLIKSERVVGK